MISVEGAIVQDIAWEILYGDVPEKLPDINKPENTALINAKKKERSEKLRRFVEGAGAPLIERWTEQIRSDNLALLLNPTSDECNCPSCLILREIKLKV